MSLLTTIKDKAVQFALRTWFQLKCNKFGNMTSLQINSKIKTIQLDLELKGETSPIKISISRYELTEEGGKTYLCVGEIETSREWINVLLANYLKERRFEVPSAVKIAL